ncbi:MAG: hypothetical protein KC621_32640 [Myxococcales bacterium]|nr:hypothetical protein [Myxococcales bacterium]
MLLWSSLVAFADEPVEVASLPAPVSATLASRWPAAKAVSAARDDGDFEVVLTEGERRFEVVVHPDGAWVETEEVVALDALPAPVKAAVHGTLVRAERTTSAAGAVVYEVLVERDGKRSEVKVDATGKVAGEPPSETDEENDGDE